MADFLEQLKNGKILLSDGAMGTELQNRGLPPGQCPESWNISHPDDVRAVIQSYLDAGSDLVETNSFGSNRYKLSHFDLADQVETFNVEAAGLAKSLAGHDRWVLGSVGSTGEFLEPLGTATENDFIKAYARQISALAKGGADAICIETMTAIDEAKAAVKAAKQVCSLPVIVTFTFDKTASGEFRTMMGVSCEQICRELLPLGADIIGSNCGRGIEDMIDIAGEFRRCTDVPIMIQANAGLPVLKNGKTIFKATPEQMADAVGQLVQSGASIIGGCCGTTPAHITAMRKAIDRIMAS